MPTLTLVDILPSFEEYFATANEVSVRDNQPTYFDLAGDARRRVSAAMHALLLPAGRC